MFLKEFSHTGKQRIAKISKLLKEEFNISLSKKIPSKAKLEKVLEIADLSLTKIRKFNPMYNVHPEYAKYLGIKDAVTIMLKEGMYAESPAYNSMKEMVESSVRKLMDSGYTMDEAVAECMNRYRMDNRFAYDDQHVLPIVITAAKGYMEECGMNYESVEEEIVEAAPETDLNDNLLRELAKECGVELEDTSSLSTIEEKLTAFAEVSGKSRDAVVGFLNGLDEAQLVAGIQMFGRKIGEANAFVKARKDAIAKGEKKFTVGGKEFTVTGDTSDEKEEVKESEGKERPYVCVHAKKGKHECTASSSYEAAKKAAAKWGLKSTAGIDAHLADVKHTATESMFDDIINDMLNEEVNVEEAEVVMAVRALADDIQDQIERLGRMVNEDIPAIADQMRSEMGAQAAQAFVDSTTGVLTNYMEAAKTAKAGMDAATSTVSGEAPATSDVGIGDTGELAEPEEPAMDVNEPAAAGPEEEPLGRAPVEV